MQVSDLMRFCPPASLILSHADEHLYHHSLLLIRKHCMVLVLWRHQHTHIILTHITEGTGENIISST